MQADFRKSLEYLQQLLDWFNGDELTDEKFEEIEDFLSKNLKIEPETTKEEQDDS